MATAPSSAVRFFVKKRHSAPYSRPASGVYSAAAGITNALISRFTAQGLYDQHWRKGNTQGQQKFRDLVLHDQGLQALGTRTDTTEGSASIYVSHLDNQVNEYYYDVMGSANRDRVSSLIHKPDAPVTALAGRHTGYGVYESGNAYLGGILIENPKLKKCKTPRILYVADFVSGSLNNGNWTINSGSSILGNTTSEPNLLNYCVNNNIDFIAAYGINILFRASTSQADKNFWQPKLYTFIATLRIRLSI